jgi:hypothetical protein
MDATNGSGSSRPYCVPGHTQRGNLPNQCAIVSLSLPLRIDAGVAFLQPPFAKGNLKMANLNALARALSGSSEDDERKRAAWNNVPCLPGLAYTATEKRDCDGRFIRWSEYGSYSEYGWQIDHIRPAALGGGDEFANLRARHWRGNSMAGTVLGNALRNIGR